MKVTQLLRRTVRRVLRDKALISDPNFKMPEAPIDFSAAADKKAATHDLSRPQAHVGFQLPSRLGAFFSWKNELLSVKIRLDFWRGRMGAGGAAEILLTQNYGKLFFRRNLLRKL